MKLSIKIKILITFCTLLLYFGIAFAEKPIRIVSLAPSITDSLYQLDAEESLVGVTSYCRNVCCAEIVGTLTNPNIEKVFSLSPDIVLTVRGVTRPQTIERLKRLGINVVVVDESRTFDDIVANFIRLSEIVGKRDLAEKIVVTIRKKVKAVADKTKNSTPIKVFWEINRRPLVTITSSSFMNEFITYSGCENIFNDIRAKHPRVSSEEVLRKNPEVIILASMGDVTIREKEYWQNFKDVEAVKNNRIYVIDADKFCRSTPSNFLMGLEEMASLLYPEIFNLEGQS